MKCITSPALENVEIAQHPLAIDGYVEDAASCCTLYELGKLQRHRVRPVRDREVVAKGSITLALIGRLISRRERASGPSDSGAIAGVGRAPAEASVRGPRLARTIGKGRTARVHPDRVESHHRYRPGWRPRRGR